MPPINDTGYEIVVGPDANGDHFSVAPDEEYTLPEPPQGVAAEETPAPVEETPSEPAPGDLSPGENAPKPDDPGSTPPSGDTQDPPGDTPPAGNDTEGAQA